MNIYLNEAKEDDHGGGDECDCPICGIGRQLRGALGGRESAGEIGISIQVDGENLPKGIMDMLKKLVGDDKSLAPPTEKEGSNC